MSYALEDIREAERLEKQSADPAYDYQEELRPFLKSNYDSILDAGCGSGVVSRFLASHFSNASVTGIDGVEARVQQARDLNQHGNLEFEISDLRELQDSSRYDLIVCRYVLEHFSNPQALQVISNFYRALKPGGQIILIDIDGYLLNTMPLSSDRIRKFLNLLSEYSDIDMRVGSKLPAFLKQMHFKEIQWELQTLQFNTPERKEREYKRIQERFEFTLPIMAQLLSSKTEARAFQKEYLESFLNPETVVFYNKFSVSASK